MTQKSCTAVIPAAPASLDMFAAPMAMWAGAFTAIYLACGMAIVMVYAANR